MSRLVRIYKRLMDITLLVSLGLLLLLVIFLLIGIFTNSYNFSSLNEPIIERDLEIILIVNVVGIVVFVVLARTFLALMQNAEKLQTAEQFRKRIKTNKVTTESFSESTIYQELNKRKEELLLEEEEDDVFEGQLSFAEEIHLVENSEDLIVNSEDLVTSVVGEPTTTKEFYTRLNKGELIELISKNSALSPYKSRKFLNAMLDTITEELVTRGEVKIEEFGRFLKQQVNEKVSINPKTQERIVVEAHNTVRFTPYKKFKDSITSDVIATRDRYLLTDSVMRELSEDEMQNELIKENIKQNFVEKELKKRKTKSE